MRNASPHPKFDSAPSQKLEDQQVHELARFAASLPTTLSREVTAFQEKFDIFFERYEGNSDVEDAHSSYQRAHAALVTALAETTQLRAQVERFHRDYDKNRSRLITVLVNETDRVAVGDHDEIPTLLERLFSGETGVSLIYVAPREYGFGTATSGTGWPRLRQELRLSVDVDSGWAALWYGVHEVPDNFWSGGLFSHHDGDQLGPELRFDTLGRHTFPATAALPIPQAQRLVEAYLRTGRAPHEPGWLRQESRITLSPAE